MCIRDRSRYVPVELWCPYHLLPKSTSYVRIAHVGYCQSFRPSRWLGHWNRPFAALGATTIDRMDACCTAGNQNARVSGTITAWACHSAKCWTITPTITGGGEGNNRTFARPCPAIAIHLALARPSPTILRSRTANRKVICRYWRGPSERTPWKP